MSTKQKSICFSNDELECFKEEQKQKWIAVGIEMSNEHAKSAPETKEAIKKINDNMDKLVSKEVFDARFEDLKEFISLQFQTNKEDHQAIWEQVKTTNGSVKELKLWKWMLAGAWAVICVGFPILAFYYVSSEDYKIDLKIKSAIERHIEQGFVSKDK